MHQKTLVELSADLRKGTCSSEELTRACLDRISSYDGELNCFVTVVEQQALAAQTRDAFQEALSESGYGQITTEILPAPAFYYAEDYHQQYLAKNPGGYCGLGGTGVSCPVGLGVAG